MTVLGHNKPFVLRTKSQSAMVMKVDQPGTTRNLIYHVYAHPASQAWRANIAQLHKRWSLFNGKKVIVIATAPDTVPASVVKDAIGPDAKYLEIPNDPRLQDGGTFGSLLKEIASLNPSEATFYAHAKGTSTKAEHVVKNAEGIMYWRNSMYHHLLDDWLTVQSALKTHPIVGCFKIDWTNWKRGDEPFWNFYPDNLFLGTWMLAGTFFWFRHDMTFSNSKALHIADSKYGGEAWPSSLWPPERGFSVYQPWPPEQRPNPNLYLAETHTERIADA